MNKNQPDDYDRIYAGSAEDRLLQAAEHFIRKMRPRFGKDLDRYHLLHDIDRTNEHITPGVCILETLLRDLAICQDYFKQRLVASYGPMLWLRGHGKKDNITLGEPVLIPIDFGDLVLFDNKNSKGLYYDKKKQPPWWECDLHEAAVAYHRETENHTPQDDGVWLLYAIPMAMQGGKDWSTYNCQIPGFIWCHYLEEREAWKISCIWVAKKCRRKGIARALLQEARRVLNVKYVHAPFTKKGLSFIRSCWPEMGTQYPKRGGIREERRIAEAD